MFIDVRRRLNRLWKLRGHTVFAATVALCAAAATAQFEAAKIEGVVRAEAITYDGKIWISHMEGGPYAGFYDGLSEMHTASVGLNGATVTATTSQVTTFSPTTIRSTGVITAAAEDAGSALPEGGGSSGDTNLYVRFTIDRSYTWTFTQGSLQGYNAPGPTSGVVLEQVSPAAITVFQMDHLTHPEFGGASAEIGPGTYEFYAQAFANDRTENEVPQESSAWDFEAVLTPLPPPACPGDADGNGAVNFADITAVLTNFGANYSPGTGIGDADRNGVVNFDDFTNVLANFGVPCP